jgi:hypothetical protein
LHDTGDSPKSNFYKKEFFEEEKKRDGYLFLELSKEKEIERCGLSIKDEIGGLQLQILAFQKQANEQDFPEEYETSNS